MGLMSILFGIIRSSWHTDRKSSRVIQAQGLGRFVQEVIESLHLSRMTSRMIRAYHHPDEQVNISWLLPKDERGHSDLAYHGADDTQGWSTASFNVARRTIDTLERQEAARFRSVMRRSIQFVELHGQNGIHRLAAGGS